MYGFYQIVLIGNIARSVRKQPFGGFADSISSYILVAFLCTALGIFSYINGGLIINKGNMLILVLGAISSTGDTLMRLVYQKYKASEMELVEEGRLKKEYDKRVDNNQSNSILVRIESDFGVGGILPILVLLGVIFNFVDIVVIYCFLYYFLASVLMISKYIIKSIKRTKEIESIEKNKN